MTSRPICCFSLATKRLAPNFPRQIAFCDFRSTFHAILRVYFSPFRFNLRLAAAEFIKIHTLKMKVLFATPLQTNRFVGASVPAAEQPLGRAKAPRRNASLCRSNCLLNRSREAPGGVERRRPATECLQTAQQERLPAANYANQHICLWADLQMMALSCSQWRRFEADEADASPRRNTSNSRFIQRRFCPESQALRCCEASIEAATVEHAPRCYETQKKGR